MYNILWIDDEWDKMKAFQLNCKEEYGLILEPFRTRKAGMEALDKDLDHWQAVLLDAKMFDENENERASLEGLRKAKQHLDELKWKKNIPYFISTGKPDLISNSVFEASFGKFYVKETDDDQLIQDILYDIENSYIIQVQHMYEDVFDALESLKIKNVTETIFTDILIPLHYPAKNPNFRPVHHFNQLRQVLEYLFRACNKVGLIPDQCMAGTNINLNQCSLYLAGKNATKACVRYGEPGEKIIPEYIEAFIRSILDFGNTHSHTVELSEEDQSKIEAIFRSKKSKYIVFGLTMQIFEVIIWLAEYIGKHNDKEINLLYCKTFPKMEEYNGRELEPMMDKNGIWHCEWCFVCIKNWDKRKKMRLKDIRVNTGDTKDKYPYYARFDII